MGCRISPFERHAYQSRRQITNQKYSLPCSQRMCQPFGEADKYLIIMIKTQNPKVAIRVYILQQTKKSFLPPQNGGVQNHLFKKKKRRPKLVSIHNFIPTDPPNLFAMITSKICDAQLQISPNKRFMLKFTVDR